MKEIAINTTTEGNYDEVSQPLFSVLIANYNNDKYLMEAIESVRQQTYTNWEIILVDDGSTDNSPSLYNELQNDERIHIFFNNENKGCGFTKHQCVLHANGELCGFMDADDALTSDALSIMVQAHLSNPNVGLIYSRYYETDADLHVKGVSQCQIEIPKDSSFLEIGGCSISHFVSFKKSAYDKTEGISPNCKRAGDHDLYYKLEEVAPILFVDKPLYYYRTETGQNISLGNNVHNAFVSDIFNMMEACKRRKLNAEDLISKRLDGYVSVFVKDAEYITANKIRSTKTYKVGKAVLSPVVFIRSLFSK